MKFIKPCTSSDLKECIIYEPKETLTNINEHELWIFLQFVVPTELSVH